ncbi:hypothetical protein C5B42_01585 [Candidatus Cerribacteria bacterium 'Amazon FNV 2010 28 9']|uniref:HTH arsR-type domain-containing protein n=1 Tax=Candidatus Cerribacteria bacterium 'Amazon FNV 2010 28 9' TaxID=2081795 RepID=A0A317JPX7_9BACT|nr:MAG: hypothetical protein C5B42_01585 [Candidatus Cerribacteria bacterium 'Amazon FNV 2010 28 9']
MAELSDFMVSKVRAKLIELFFRNPSEMWYVRELTRLTGEEINAVRRELARMTESGMVKSEERGNRLYYMLNHHYEFFPELLTAVAKTSGLGKDMKRNRKKLGDIDFIMFSGKFARFGSHSNTDVDILIVGNVVLPELSVLVKKEEEKRGYEINYTVISKEEFEFRKERRDPFLREILAGSRVMIIGSEDEMLETKPQLST